MKLKVKRDDLTNQMATTDIPFAVLEAKDAHLLVELMKRARDKHTMMQKEVFANASDELKNEIIKLTKGKFNFEAPNEEIEMDFKRHFKSRELEALKPVDLSLDGNSFNDLENAVLETNDAGTILAFARTFKVNDKKFLKALEPFGEIYTRAYYRDVIQHYAFQQDDLQLHM